MTFTVTIGELSIFLAGIAFFILVIYLIPLIIQLRNTAKAVEEFSQKGREAMEDLNLLVRNLNGPAEDIGGVVKKAAEVGLKAVNLTDMVVNQLKRPVITISSIITGIEFGLKHFKKKEGDKDVKP